MILRAVRKSFAPCLLLLAIAPASAAATEHPRFRVIFEDARTLDVFDARIDGREAILILGAAEDRLVVPAHRVVRIEPLAPPADPVSPVEPHPAAQPPDVTAAIPSVQAASPPPLDPPVEEDLETIIRDAAARHGIEPDLLAAVIAVESGYRADALSPKGAQGLMQLMPATARELAVEDPFDPRQNIDAGARYLRQLLDEHDGAFWKALAAYNAGQGRVARYNGLPPYQETIQYVKRVLDRYQKPKAIPAAPARATRPTAPGR